ncbi:MAG: DUF898 domain-containing protein [Spirochaetes bacterium]|nr:DUF898 domain-containing protein [Spirochaetota bacterium]
MPNQKQTSNPAQQRPNTYKFEFTGSGGAYFRIWIVNILLSILTLGIYSAWAKVRTNQYFYRCAKLDNTGFDYHGSPIAILKGRIIAVVLIAALNISQHVHMAVYAAVLILFLVIMPWLVAKSLAFRMHNTSWRSIRFRFKGTVGEAAKCLYAYGLLTAITLGIAYPVQFRKIKKYTFDNTSFGKTGFSFTANIGAIYRVFLLTALFVVIIFIGFGIVTASGVGAIKENKELFGIISVISVTVLYFGLIIVVYPFYKTKITNLTWNNTALGAITFQSTLTVKKYFAVIAGNLVLTLLTLGLYWPWAVIKLIRMRMDYLKLTAPEGLDAFAADISEEVGAAGEEISSAFDFDISF